jgi:hypothetical protein
VAVLNPAFAAAIIGGSMWRNVMYSLIWRSVMWRPGKGQFSIGVKNASISSWPQSPDERPFRGGRCRWIRDFAQATPSLRRKPSDAFSSRLTRHSQPDCRASNRLSWVEIGYSQPVAGLGRLVIGCRRAIGRVCSRFSSAMRVPGFML